MINVHSQEFEDQCKIYDADTISRNIRKLKDGTLEVSRYDDSFFKGTFFPIVFALCIALVVGAVTYPDFYKDIVFAINPDISLKKSYYKNYLDPNRPYSNKKKDPIRNIETVCSLLISFTMPVDNTPGTCSSVLFS